MAKRTPKIILFLIFIFLHASFFSRAQAYMKDDKVISAGYGFAPIDFGNVGDFFNDNSASYSYNGPFYLKFDNALTERVSMGIDMSYGHYTDVPNQNNNFIPYNYYTPGYATKETYSTFSAVVRLNWHYGNFKNFDPYWGFGFGYRSFSYSYYINADPTPYSVSDENTIPLAVEIIIGMRYYVSPAIGLYMETGISSSVVQFGLSFKVK